jgi:hypothetical protein
MKEEVICKVISLKVVDVVFFEKLYSCLSIGDNFSKALDNYWATLKGALGILTEKDPAGKIIPIPHFFKAKYYLTRDLMPP